MVLNKNASFKSGQCLAVNSLITCVELHHLIRVFSGTALEAKEQEVEDLEGRIANTEAALNTANAQLEDEADSRGLPTPQSRGLGDTAFEPQLPDIMDKGAQREDYPGQSQAEKLEELEDVVANLQSELRELRTLHSEQQSQLELAQVYIPTFKQLVENWKSC